MSLLEAEQGHTEKQIIKLNETVNYHILLNDYVTCIQEKE